MTNSYGSLCGWLVAVFMRGLSGEPVLNIPAFIQYPAYITHTGEQLFPFKTLIVLLSLFTILTVSKMAHFLFTQHILPPSWDVFEYFVTNEEKKFSDLADLNGTGDPLVIKKGVFVPSNGVNANENADEQHDTIDLETSNHYTDENEAMDEHRDNSKETNDTVIVTTVI